MGIEILIIAVIVIIVVVAGVMRLRGQDEPINFSPGTSASNEPDRKKRKSDETSAEPEPMTQPPQSNSAPSEPSAPPSGLSSDKDDLSLGGMVGGDDDEWDDEDGFVDAEAEEEYIPDKEGIPVNEEIKPGIEDTQTMKAVSPSDTQEMKEALEQAPKELLPKEVTDWMDGLEEEASGATQELSSVEDGESDDRLDTEYPQKEAPPATTAHFSAFYPKEAEAGGRYGVYIYAHAESMLAKITEDAQKFKAELGGDVPQPRTAKTSKSLVHGTKITVLLESEELEFEPEMITKRWHGDWTRYEFEFRSDSELVNETAFVRASIMVMGFEIAKIKFAIEIVEPQMKAMSMPTTDELPTNPFARAKMQSATTDGYSKIFISYSRKDKLIAEAFKIMQEAAGNDVFFDVDDIRTGEDWQAAIARAIDEADYLQLFWSDNSANSEWCSYEWDYAMNYRCADNKCREFIRPVWWITPMPPPPDLLGHLNFRRMDFETLMQGDE